MPLNIRRATEPDAALIAATGLAVWIGTYARDAVTRDMAEYVLAEFTEPRIRQHLARPGTTLWLAETDTGIVGFADVTAPAITPALPDTVQAEITRLYVLERFTRQGIGEKLLHHTAAHAFASGATAVWLSVWTGNQRAIDFYKKQNWLHVGETSFPLGGTAHPNHIFALRK